MGKTNKTPVAVIKNYNFESKNESISSVIRDEKDDLFR